MVAFNTANSVFILLIAVLLTIPLVSADSYPAVFDDSPGLGRRFDGVGAISGGGGTSKLLVNYPEEQRNQTLDYLFKPGFGASLQIIKVEIGGDVQGAVGVEPSHMHNNWEENYERGYEWWILQEAKKRNPDIKVYALPWGFPLWVGNGTANPFVNVTLTADYILRWIKAANTTYNVSVDYIGIWDEMTFNIAYIKTLRSMLDSAGFNKTKIVAFDSTWSIADDILKDPELADSIYAIGSHYPRAKSTSEAIATGKVLWDSEDFTAVNDNVGGGCMARIVNQNYVTGLMTSTIAWNLVASYYPKIAYASNGLMTAAEPWSGHYEVKSPIWITAHTTQFVPIGWTYLKHSSGVAKLKYGGSYVSMTDSQKKNLTIVIETMTHNHSVCSYRSPPPFTVTKQDVVITLKGNYSSIKQMNVWHSKLGFDGATSVLFEKKDPIAFTNGQATLSLDVDEVYTLTTMTNGQKGLYPTPPPSKPFPLPYSDDFEAYAVFKEPSYLSPQIGSFEVVQSEKSKVVRQTVLEKPIAWCQAESLGKAVSIIGSNSWTDIFAEVSFEIPAVNGTKGVFVAARIHGAGCLGYGQAIVFFAFEDKYIVSNDFARKKVLKTGPLPKSSGWHKISLLVKGDTVTGAFDKKQVFQMATPSSPSNGWVGFGTDSFGLADFDNLTVTTSSDGDAIMRSYAVPKHPKFFRVP